MRAAHSFVAYVSALAMALVALTPTPASADVIEVPCGADGQGQLAHINGAFGQSAQNPGVDTIVLDGDCTYTGGNVYTRATSETTIVEGNGATLRHVGTDPDLLGTVLIIEADHVVLRDLTITGGYAPQWLGGGIFARRGDHVLENVTVTGNTALLGGGIKLPDHLGSMTLINSTVSDNVAIELGGGILSSLYSRLVLINSTVTGNSTEELGGGGGLWLYGDRYYPGTGGDWQHMIINSTVSENQGYGMVIWGTTGVQVVNSVFVRNVDVGGGVSDCYSDGHYGHGYNVYGVGNCNGGVGDSTNPNLYDQKASNWFGPLADNGGSTLTYAPEPDTPPIDFIPVGQSGCGVVLQEFVDHLPYLPPGDALDLSTDQRGLARPQGQGCEPGAVEYRPGDEAQLSPVVTTTVDAAGYDDACTLRDAMTAVFQDFRQGGCVPPADGVVRFADDLGEATIPLRTLLPEVAEDLAIDGGGDITIDAGGTTGREYVFNLTSGHLDLSGLTLTGADGVPGVGVLARELTPDTLGLSVVDSWIHDNRFAGIVMQSHDSSRTLEVSGSTISNHGTNGIAVNVSGTGGTDFTMRNSTVHDSGVTGIVLRQSSEAALDAMIDSSTITGSLLDGISMTGAVHLSQTNSVVAASEGSDCATDNPFDAVLQGSDNLTTDGTCPGSTQATDAQLGLGPCRSTTPVPPPACPRPPAWPGTLPTGRPRTARTATSAGSSVPGPRAGPATSERSSSTAACWRSSPPQAPSPRGPASRCR